MKRNILLSAVAAGLLSVAAIGAGCEQDNSEHTRTGSARGETMQATGQPGIGADKGTGTTASGVTTGNATTGGPTVAADASGNRASASVSGSTANASVSNDASAKVDAGSPGQTASNAGQGPAGIDQPNTDDKAAEAAVAAARPAPQDVTADAGPASVDRTATAAEPTPATPAAPANADAAQLAAAEDKKDEKHEHDDAHHAKADAWAKVKPSAAAPKDMQVTGTVSFTKAEHGVTVHVDLKGLTPNSKHGFHIHEKGDLSDPKLVSAGPHFNPGGKKHGGPEGEERHGGDLGNITADDKGNAKADIMAHGVTIDGEKDGIVGRSIIVHAKPDDEKTDPSGNSGDRIAGGTIEKAKAKSADAGGAAGSTDAAQTASAKTSADAAPATDTPAAPDAADLNK